MRRSDPVWCRQGFDIIHGTDLPLDPKILRNGRADDPAACCLACLQSTAGNVRCTAWSFVLASRQCWLKDVDPNP